MVSETAQLPRHIGYIVDGNRRWARQHGLPTYEGHLAGYNTLKDIVLATIEAGIDYVSLYTFSTENWKRDDKEVKYLMKLLHRLVKTDLQELIDNNIRVQFLGIKDKLSNQIIEDMQIVEQKSQHLRRGTVALCLNYGGQREIVDAVKKCIEDGLRADEVTEESLAARLYHPEIPPVDLVVRTSGEQRLSNFMLWRSAYSEIIFINKLWPDMKKEDVGTIIKEYNKRTRRFGG